MKSKVTRVVFTGLFGLASMLGSANAAPPASELKAFAHDGQVFLTWKEADTPRGTTFNIYVSGSPISAVTNARRIAHHVEQHSARDWWEDPASFKKDAPAGNPTGFRLQGGGQRLDPKGGLFVHTVRKDPNGRLFFAVTCSDSSGKEDTAIVPGANSFVDGIQAASDEIKPVWQREGPQPAPGAGKDKALSLTLHGKSGVIANMEYLAFGDETMGWREGLPFKFSVLIQNDKIVVRPTDRVWINRPHDEAGDGEGKAIWTFWYGYNSNIEDSKLMAAGIPANYTERRNLWILKWVHEHYQPSSNRWYCSGSSMGGCGTISFGLRHPELFAACHAHVPIVSYTYLGTASARRLEPSCWTGPIPQDLICNEGLSLLVRMNGTKFVTESKGDLPFVFLVNGRQDASIPWENNPSFYRALNDTQRGFAAYWDNGTHSASGKDAPEDVKAWTLRLHRFRLDESYPAFSNTSSNRNPGNGSAHDGDLIGWMNRGMDWKDIEDSSDHYAITLLADYPGIQYPVQTDVTLRHVQGFQTKPHEQFTVAAGDAEPFSIRADAAGRITVPSVSIPSANGVRVLVRR